MANGEVRTLINMVEAIFLSKDQENEITLEFAKNIILKPNISIDKNDITLIRK